MLGVPVFGVELQEEAYFILTKMISRWSKGGVRRRRWVHREENSGETNEDGEAAQPPGREYK